MAKVSNPLIGRSSGKIGSVIMQTYKGLNIMREKPLTVANPQTEKQRESRAKLAFLVSLYRLFAAFFQKGFRQAQNPLSPYNWFISTNNNDGLLNWDGSEVTPDYTALKASKGTMEETHISSAVYNSSTGGILITFPTSLAGTQQKSTDRLNVMVINKDTQEIIAAENTGIARNAGSFTIATGQTGLDPNDLAIITYFTSVDSKNTSDSVLTNVS
jgi:hypothetical protein